MQKSYTDCAIHIVCIFGLTGEVFSQTLVGGKSKRHYERQLYNDIIRPYEKFSHSIFYT